MKKLILLLLVAMIPFLTMAQKKSKKRSKNDKISNSTNIASAYDENAGISDTLTGSLNKHLSSKLLYFKLD